MPVRIVATGADVLPRAETFLTLTTAQPLAHGATQIPQGTIDRQQGLVILGALGGEAYYIHDNTLKAAGIQEFLSGYFIGQTAGLVYQRTQWIMPATQIVSSFVMGVAVGFAGLLVAVVAGGIITLVRITVFLNGHVSEIETVRDQLPLVASTLRWFKANCPVLYAKLTSVLWAGFVTAIESSPDGTTVKDVAAILGRLLGGVANAPQAGFATLAGILARTLAGYAILHMPGAVVQGADAQKIASSLVDALRQQKASITPAEAEQIRQELMRTVGAIAQLHRLHTALNTLAPVLVKLLEDFSR